jgi:plastocyanin
MNTKTVWIVLIVVLVAAGAWYALSPKPASAPSETATTTQESTAADTASGSEEDGGPAFAVITLTDSGFSPASVTVAVGETVRFVNDSSRGMWVASDNHPTHTEYDGTSTREHCVDGKDTTGTFDECSAAANGDFWDYTFQKAGTFGFHNHVSASNTGTVIVK